MIGRFLLAYALMLVIFGVGVGVTVYLLSKADISPIVKYAPCKQFLLGNEPGYYCADGHGWARTHEGWRDLGPVGPPPWRPAR